MLLKAAVLVLLLNAQIGFMVSFESMDDLMNVMTASADVLDWKMVIILVQQAFYTWILFRSMMDVVIGITALIQFWRQEETLIRLFPTLMRYVCFAIFADLLFGCTLVLQYPISVFLLITLLMDVFVKFLIIIILDAVVKEGYTNFAQDEKTPLVKQYEWI